VNSQGMVLFTYDRLTSIIIQYGLSVYKQAHNFT